MVIRPISTNSAGFSSPVDYFEIIGDAIALVSSSLNKSNSEAEALDENGDAFAFDVYGEVIAPEASYKLKDEALISAFGPLGKVVTIDDVKVMITEVVVETAAGTAPNITVTGTQVGASASGARTFVLGGDEATITPKCRVQFPFGEITAEGGHITTARYTASITPDDTTVSGIPIGLCATNGKIVVELIITSSTKDEPTVTGSSFVWGALTVANEDAAYPEWTITGTAYLAPSETAAATE